MSGAPGFATGQVTIDNVAGGVLLAAARLGRHAITIINHGTTVVYVGNRGLTSSTGARLPGVEGAAITITTQDAVYGIAGSAQAVSVVETY
ncbi:MAG: hypothetical protein IT537_03260 [Hyphomicrobiales bacterium]|nr:hypothetical protein [Hyphomicrobiales bacterium]